MSVAMPEGGWQITMKITEVMSRATAAFEEDGRQRLVVCKSQTTQSSDISSSDDRSPMPEVRTALCLELRTDKPVKTSPLPTLRACMGFNPITATVLPPRDFAGERRFQHIEHVRSGELSWSTAQLFGLVAVSHSVSFLTMLVCGRFNTTTDEAQDRWHVRTRTRDSSSESRTLPLRHTTPRQRRFEGGAFADDLPGNSNLTQTAVHYLTS
ncbi:hypothetical protein Bbelb_141580 [Branchiostoma belcheri]|nr:hypothetical protein Bbelb_141580 [Branchiostoma belcheri]